MPTHPRKVIAWLLSDKPNAELVIETFRKAYRNRNCPQGLMFHSDPGSQYTSQAFRKILDELNVVQSFSGKGCYFDNAVLEAFFKFLKAEETNRNTFRNGGDIMQWQKFPATREDYYSMLDFVMKEAEKAGVPENRQIYLELGFKEAASNIINYAYSAKQGGEISISAYREAEHFFIELKNSGVPFNPLTNIKDVEKTSDLESAKVGGLGIFKQIV